MSAKLRWPRGEVLQQQQQQQPCNTFYSVYQMMKYFQLTTSQWDNGTGGAGGGAGGRRGQLQTHLTSDQL